MNAQGAANYVRFKMHLQILRNSRVAIGIEIKIQTNVDFPADFGSRKEILFVRRKAVVPDSVRVSDFM